MDGRYTCHDDIEAGGNSPGVNIGVMIVKSSHDSKRVLEEWASAARTPSCQHLAFPHYKDNDGKWVANDQRCLTTLYHERAHFRTAIKQLDAKASHFLQGGYNSWIKHFFTGSHTSTSADAVGFRVSRELRKNINCLYLIPILIKQSDLK